MTLDQIKQAIADGKSVKWANDLYDVIKDCKGQYLIVCKSNKYTIGLTWMDGVTMNGRENEFYVAIDISKPVKLIDPYPGEEASVFKITNYNEASGRCYIQDINSRLTIPGQELVSVKALINI